MVLQASMTVNSKRASWDAQGFIWQFCFGHLGIWNVAKWWYLGCIMMYLVDVNLYCYFVVKKNPIQYLLRSQVRSRFCQVWATCCWQPPVAPRCKARWVFHTFGRFWGWSFGCSIWHSEHGSLTKNIDPKISTKIASSVPLPKNSPPPKSPVFSPLIFFDEKPWRPCWAAAAFNSTGQWDGQWPPIQCLVCRWSVFWAKRWHQKQECGLGPKRLLQKESLGPESWDLLYENLRTFWHFWLEIVEFNRFFEPKAPI